MNGFIEDYAHFVQLHTLIYDSEIELDPLNTEDGDDR